MINRQKPSDEPDQADDVNSLLQTLITIFLFKRTVVRRKRNMSLKSLFLFSAAAGVAADSNGCLSCSDSCSLVPPADKKGYPCYQGDPKNANFCYNTDPLLADGTTYQCGTCESAGFSTYLRNDPIYKNMELWQRDSEVTEKSDACLSCPDSCSLVPPADKKGYPCYQGDPKNANFCYNTDPLLAEGTTYQCGTCESAGFSTYLRNDPIYKNMELWQRDSEVTEKSDACLSCSDSCSLVPPADKKGYPCYQGDPKNANFCYNTDPLLAEGTTYQCGTCESAGFSTYLRNDPIYKNMELWQRDSEVTEKSDACLSCSDSCSLVPPADKKGYPCYQGDPKNANFCYNTDPLLAEGTTYQCGTCASAGYDTYLANDPIYQNMELWKNSGKNATA